jgi:TonB family protein
VAARVMRGVALLLVASTAVGAQASGDRVVYAVLGTPLNRVEVWAVAAAQIGITLTRGERSVGCGASVGEMRAWADSLDQFSERLRGYSAIDTAKLVSPPIPGCGIDATGAPVGGVRTYALRHVGTDGVETRVAVTSGTLRRVATDVREVANLVDSAAARVARMLQMQRDDPRLRDAPAPKPPGEPYFDFQVDRSVRPVSGSRGPTYPEELRAQAIEGEVLAQFVVDTNGTVLEGSLRVLRSTHAEFEAAVRRAVPQLLFSPAIKDGRNVRQMVQQPFHFRLERE